MYEGTITRKMKSTRTNIYKDLLTQDDFTAQLAKLMEAEKSNSSQFHSICDELCKMFQALEIPVEKGQPGSYYEKICQDNAAKIPEFRDIEQRILKIMYDSFQNYPTPEEYMLRMVNRLSNPKDGWQGDSLRLRILKQFVQYTDCLTYRDTNGKIQHIYQGVGYLKKYVKEKSGKTVKNNADILANLDDRIFDVLSTAKKEQKKADGTYGILKLAEDLSKGIFKNGGATKRDLYLFAIAYGMTYTIHGDTEPTEAYYEKDIAKNLFEDYYSNNLMRFITESYTGNLSAFEMDPSGQGINYKNFAEMVYIYFIAKDMEPLEKLKGATEMIERLKFSHKKLEFSNTSTKYYTTLFTEDILQKNEADFEDFIANNYDCNVEYTYTDKNGKLQKGTRGIFELQTLQQTAFAFYKNLIAQMEHDKPPLLRSGCNYGLWFTDVSAYRKYGTKRMEKILQDAYGRDQSYDASKIEKFLNLLLRINAFLGNLFVEDASEIPEQIEKSDTLQQQYEKYRKSDLLLSQENDGIFQGAVNLSQVVINKMAIEEPEHMTRTALIVAYYYRYNQRYEDASNSFMEVMDEYTDSKYGLNSILEASGYLPISDRNIFDLAVVFSSYAYCL